MLDVLIADRLDWLLGYHKEQSIVWNDNPEIDVAKNFDSIYKAMSSEWCKCTSNFVLNHWDIYEKYPDIFFDVNAIYVFRSGSESYWHMPWDLRVIR